MEQRSTFVTVVGWVFIVLSALLLLEGLTVAFTPADTLLSQLPQGQGTPAIDPALFERVLHGMAVFICVVMIWVLLSAIGLLRRKNWARISFIVMMALGIAWWTLYVLSALLTRGSVSAAAGAMGQAIVTVMIVMSLLFIAFFAWVLIKLNSAKIKQEFLPPPSQS